MSQHEPIKPLSISHWMTYNSFCPDRVIDPVRSAIDKFSLAAISSGTHSPNVESIGIHFILSENTKLKPPYIGRVSRIKNSVGAGIELRWSDEKNIDASSVQMTMCKSLLALLLGAFRTYAVAEEPFLKSLSEYQPWNGIVRSLLPCDVVPYLNCATWRPVSIDEEAFWALIEKAKPAEISAGDQGVRLYTELSKLPPEDVGEFAFIFHSKMAELYRYDLWAIAYIINGGCSDDGFTYFRAWLICQGREFYNQAIVRPEFVGEQVSENVSDEVDLMAFSVYEEMTGYEMHFIHPGEPLDPIGPGWDENDLPRLYPAICEKFGF